MFPTCIHCWDPPPPCVSTFLESIFKSVWFSTWLKHSSSSSLRWKAADVKEEVEKDRLCMAGGSANQHSHNPNGTSKVFHISSSHLIPGNIIQRESPVHWGDNCTPCVCHLCCQWKQPVPFGGWIKKIGHTYDISGKYSAGKHNEILLFIATWTCPAVMTLREISYIQRGGKQTNNNKTCPHSQERATFVEDRK